MKIGNNGITLVALIITIIVLLILATVSISLVINSGIINTSEYGVKKTQIEEDKEQLLLAVADSVKFDGTVNYDNLNNNLPEGFQESNGVYIKGKNKYTVNIYGNVDTLLPYGYKECEYLESTGTRNSGNQYINTEYAPTINTNISIKYKLPEWYDHNSLYTLLGSNNLSIRFKRFSGSLTTIFKKGKNEVSNYRWGFIYEDIYNMSIYGSEAKLINSQETYTGTIDMDYTDNTSLPIFLWALNTENGASEKIRGRIYYFTIYENSNITANFIPALDSNNKPCMFDTISKKAFYNQGSGEFIAGPEV